jgi:hypothetical protein
MTDSIKRQERERLARQQQEEEDAVFARSLQQQGQLVQAEDAMSSRSLAASQIPHFPGLRGK